MRMRTWMVVVAAAALFGVLAPAARAQKKRVKVIKEWKGSVADEKLQKSAPACVTNAKDLEKLWKAWMVEGKMPDVDFSKEIVVITTTRGSRLNLFCNLDDKGDLEVGGFGTRDLRPGFRYVIGLVSREGVKKINGKEMPKD